MAPLSWVVKFRGQAAVGWTLAWVKTSMVWGKEVGGWEPGSGPSSDLIFRMMLTSACLFLSLGFLKCSKQVER